MKTKFLFLITICLFISSALFAQDKIYPRNSKSYILAKITEVGIDEIKYKEYDNLDGPQFTIEKDDIEKIVYANGRVEKFEQSISAKVPLKEMHKNNIKLAFFSPLLGHTHLSYERGVKQGQAWEVHASLIGVSMIRSYNYIYNQQTGVQEIYYKKQRGLLLGAGYKFSFTPDYVARGIRKRHIMQGSFVRPSFYLGDFSYSYYNYDNFNNKIVENKKNIFTGALMLELGKQWILSNRASLEFYAGIGYGFDNRKVSPTDFFNVNDYASFYYLYSRASTNRYSPSFVALSSGIKLGYLFHTKKEKELEKGEVKKKK